MKLERFLERTLEEIEESKNKIKYENMMIEKLTKEKDTVRLKEHEFNYAYLKGGLQTLQATYLLLSGNIEE